MTDDPEVAELRKKLVGVKWEDFIDDEKVVIDGVSFSGRYGSFLRKSIVAVIANDKFIIITLVPSSIMNHKRKIELIIDPLNLETGDPIMGVHIHLRDYGIDFVLREDENGRDGKPANQSR